MRVMGRELGGASGTAFNFTPGNLRLEEGMLKRGLSGGRVKWRAEIVVSCKDLCRIFSCRDCLNDMRMYICVVCIQQGIVHVAKYNLHNSVALAQRQFIRGMRWRRHTPYPGLFQWLLVLDGTQRRSTGALPLAPDSSGERKLPLMFAADQTFTVADYRQLI